VIDHPTVSDYKTSTTLLLSWDYAPLKRTFNRALAGKIARMPESEVLMEYTLGDASLSMDD